MSSFQESSPVLALMRSAKASLDVPRRESAGIPALYFPVKNPNLRGEKVVRPRPNSL